MPSNTSSMTYPSASGSENNRSPSFWSLPTLIQSPALSNQSMVTNVSSEIDMNGLEVLVSFPSETVAYKFHEQYTEWYIMVCLVI